MAKQTLRVRNKGLVKVKVADLEEAPWNHRDHPLLQQEALAGAIADPLIGYAGYPDVYDAGDGVLRLIDGHLRKGILISHYGPETEIEVNLTDFDEAGAKAYNLTKDPLAALAESNRPKLDALLAENAITSEPLIKMLEELAAEAGCDWHKQQEIEEDEIPAPPTTPITQPGDLWVLGRHRLICGDSTSPEVVRRLLEGRRPFLMVTDPPYGVAYKPEWRNEVDPRPSRRLGLVANDDRSDWTEAYRLFPGKVAYVWHAGQFSGELVNHLKAAEFDVRAQIIWKKPKIVFGRGHYHWQHEPCWYAVREGESAKWNGDRTQSTIWEIAHLNRTNKDAGADSTTEHGTQKPVECMARPIRNHGEKKDDVYDPFLGSGTTLIAAEQLGRSCFGVELDPGYCDVIVRRWEAITLRKAHREPAPMPPLAARLPQDGPQGAEVVESAEEKAASPA